VSYLSISVSAASLKTTEENLIDFGRKGWIDSVQKNGEVLLAADQRYRAKYILFLAATKHLSDEQIELVLSIQRPPYSAAGVDELLKQHKPKPNLKNGGR
jgi:hypothetical protein